jgi:hypothetical protein
MSREAVVLALTHAHEISRYRDEICLRSTLDHVFSLQAEAVAGATSYPRTSGSLNKLRAQFPKLDAALSCILTGGISLSTLIDDAEKPELANEDTPLLRFVSYLFETRHGWSKLESGPVSLERDGRNSHSPSPAQAEDYQGVINARIDKLISLLRLHPVSGSVLRALLAVIRATDNPSCRHATFKFFFDWIKFQMGNDKDMPTRLQEHFPLLQTVIISGLTDVWSAIRKTCNGKLYDIAEAFNITQVNAPFRFQFCACFIQFSNDHERYISSSPSPPMCVCVCLRAYLLTDRSNLF